MILCFNSREIIYRSVKTRARNGAILIFNDIGEENVHAFM